MLHADEKVHVELSEIHLGNEIVAAKESLYGAKPLHLKVFVLDVLVGLTEIHASLHIAIPIFEIGKRLTIGHCRSLVVAP